MGKGQIISEIGNGKYSVKIIYGYRDKINARIASMQDQITYLNGKIAEAEDGLEKEVMELQVASLEKQIEVLNTQMPDDPTRELWCSDFTTGLSGDVGLIEIPGEIAQKVTYLNSQSRLITAKYTKINIRPGYSGDVAYLKSRDGEIVPVVAMSAAQMFYNKAVLPGVQKWQPTVRYGIIVADSIDFDLNTCSVCLDPEYSSQQNLGVNQGDTFSECDGEVPGGFDQFCTDNPGHPTCVNTAEGGGYWITDEMLATMKSINESVNSEHEYQTDKSGYGIGEHWTEMSAGEKGDCEDFALTKQKALYDAGVPIQHLQLAIGETETGGWHAFLMIRSGNRGDLVLDNRFANVTKLENVPYRFHSYQNAGSQWNGYGVRLADVSIEYMNCNALAFADGDEVVVEFTGQDFSKPSVIGFKANPAGCAFNIMLFQGQWKYPYGELFGFDYDREADSFTKTGILSAYDGQNYHAAAASPDNGKNSHYLGGNSAAYRTNPADHGLEQDSNRQYTKETDSWQTKKEMIDPKQYHGAFGLGGKIYETGGFGGNPLAPTIQNSNNEYNPSTDSWTSKTNIGNRFLHAAITLGDYGYALGGFTQIAGYPITNSLTRYDAIGNYWLEKTGYDLPVAYPNFFADTETGKGYCAGGATLGRWGSGHAINDDPLICLTERCYEYDPTANTWSRVGDSLTHGCEGQYYEDAAPPGWYINPDDCENRDGFGFYRTPYFGGVDSGVVFQKAVSRSGGFYHVMPTCEYKPSADTWTGKQGYPEIWLPFYLLDGGCAC